MEKSAKNSDTHEMHFTAEFGYFTHSWHNHEMHVFNFYFCTFPPPGVLQNHLYNLATKLSGRNNMYSQGTLYYHA